MTGATFLDVAFVAALNQAASGVVDACAVVFFGSITGGGDSFECYSVANPVVVTLSGGNSWTGAWRYAVGYSGQQAMDTFETYGTGAISTLNDGLGWTGAWVIS